MALYARTHRYGAVSHADMIDRLADALEVVTPVWEYGLRRAEPHETGIPWYAHTTGDTLKAVAAWKTKHEELLCRPRAGEWQPTPVEGESE